MSYKKYYKENKESDRSNKLFKNTSNKCIRLSASKEDKRIDVNDSISSNNSQFVLELSNSIDLVQSRMGYIEEFDKLDLSLIEHLYLKFFPC